MAKREEAVNMTAQFAEFKELKDIDKTTLISVLEESFRSVLSKMFGNDDNFDVIVNPDKGDCEIYQNLEVVPDGEVENPNKQISLSEAQADDDPDCEVGEEHTRKIDFAKFGRRAILNLRQTLASKILDLQKDAIYNKFKALEGQLVAGEVYQVWKREVLLLDDDKNELLLPKEESLGALLRTSPRARALFLRHCEVQRFLFNRHRKMTAINNLSVQRIGRALRGSHFDFLRAAVYDDILQVLAV